MKAYQPNKIRAVRVYFPNGYVPQINVSTRDCINDWQDMICPISPFKSPESAIAWALDEIMMEQP